MSGHNTDRLASDTSIAQDTRPNKLPQEEVRADAMEIERRVVQVAACYQNFFTVLSEDMVRLKLQKKNHIA